MFPIKVFLFTNCCTSGLKNNFKIDIKTDLTCFGAVIPSSGSALLVLAKVTVVKIANYNTLVCGDVAAYIRSTNKDLLICRQSIKNPNLCNSEPGSKHCVLTMMALCSRDFKLYSDTSTITPCQLVIELHVLE